MRTRSILTQKESRPLSSPSLSMVSSNNSSPNEGSGMVRRISPNNKSPEQDCSPRSDCSMEIATPLVPHRTGALSPVNARTLTYSPTKAKEKRSRRITVLLLGFMMGCVLLTMLCSLLLMGHTLHETPEHSFDVPRLRRHSSDARRVDQEKIPALVNGTVDKPPLVKPNDVASPQLTGDQQVSPNKVDTNGNRIKSKTTKSPVKRIPAITMKNGVDKKLKDLSRKETKSKDAGDNDALEKPASTGKESLETKVTDLEEPVQVVDKPATAGKETLETNDARATAREEPLEGVAEPAAAAEKESLETNDDAKVTAPKEPVPVDFPRVVYIAADDPPTISTHRELEDDPMLHAPPGFEAVEQDRMKPDYSEGDCVPMHEWQTKSFPNCNVLHEYDMKAADSCKDNNCDSLVLLGQGWFRHTWKLNTSNDTVVLKTLRLEREFYDEYYDLHRRDAVAMERLTGSPFVMDIYGFCGQSALNELADFGDGKFASLEKFDRQMRGNHNPEASLLKLQVASSIAVGVAHVHEIDIETDDRPSMVHYDLNPRNIAIVGKGKPKLNDFNIAEFLRWNPKTNTTCGFPSRLHEPWWRAPEEVSLSKSPDRPLLDEKVDIYALGNLLFHVLTTHSPRGKISKKDRLESVREKVLKGEPPELGAKYRKSKDPAVKAIVEAMDLCFQSDPRKRGSAREVAEILINTLMDLKNKKKKKKK